METKKIKVSELTPENKAVLTDIQKAIQELLEKYSDPHRYERPKPKLVHVQ